MKNQIELIFQRWHEEVLKIKESEYNSLIKNNTGKIVSILEKIGYYSEPLAWKIYLINKSDHFDENMVVSDFNYEQLIQLLIHCERYAKLYAFS